MLTQEAVCIHRSFVYDDDEAKCRQRHDCILKSCNIRLFSDLMSICNSSFVEVGFCYANEQIHPLCKFDICLLHFAPHYNIFLFSMILSFIILNPFSSKGVHSYILSYTVNFFSFILNHILYFGCEL